jgi:hypothetical protein
MMGGNNLISVVGKAILTVVLIGLLVAWLVKWFGPLIEGVGSKIAKSTEVNESQLTTYNELASTALTQTSSTSQTLFVFILVAAIATIALISYLYIKSVIKE